VDRIHVSDGLDPGLDVTTVRHVSTGGRLDLATRTLTWDLRDQRLGAGQTGFVSFWVNARTDLPECTPIANTAVIEMDDGAALVTEPTLNATAGCAAECSLYDETPPVVTAGGLTLWPPNHALVEVSLGSCATAVDDCLGELDLDAVAQVLFVTSDEPIDDPGGGDGKTAPDVVIDADGRVFLRAERQGAGDGRVYSITFSVADDRDNQTEATCLVQVPHSAYQAATDSGPAYSVSP
jgi:hypothetical protein